MGSSLNGKKVKYLFCRPLTIIRAFVKNIRKSPFFRVVICIIIIPKLCQFGENGDENGDKKAPCIYAKPLAA